MSTLVSPTPELERLQARKAEVVAIRDRARELYRGGATGIHVSASLFEKTIDFFLRLFEEQLAPIAPDNRAVIEQHAAVIAIGGTGRGELAPFSDVDLLFLYRGPARSHFSDLTSLTVRAVWDAGIKLGHSIRTTGETLSLAKQDAEVATAIVESRLLWGSRTMFEQFSRNIYRKVVRGRRTAFIESCLRARQEEREKHGATVQQLEPDVKCSQGGLRDIHLLRWIGYAHHGTPDVNTLRLKGALTKEDARQLLAAQEFLTRVRADLHFHADKPQDLLSRDEQLRIADQFSVTKTASQRPVERLMQNYFEHSAAIGEIVERFVARHRPRTWKAMFAAWTTTHVAEGLYRVDGKHIDVIPRKREHVLGSLERILSLYHTAVLYGVTPTPRLADQIKTAAQKLDAPATTKCGELFLEILSATIHLAPILRSMFNTGVLDRVLPELTHARCLLQFNQYHSYTVDEHTLRTLEAVTKLETDDGPLGVAYDQVHHKEVLHLALLLHDAGKGYEEDHSEVGKRLAEQVAARLPLPEHRGKTLAFLVHKHLQMAHLAFRRDIYDPSHLLPFTREVETPDTLRMLYALTYADLKGVGPGVWNDWKAELLAELYNRAMYVLSGRQYKYREEQRLEEIKRHVRQAVEADKLDMDVSQWIDEQLDAFPPHYLGDTAPQQIARDLATIQCLTPGELFLDGEYDAETNTVEYRLIAHADSAAGCFHRTVGVLTAKRMQIVSAEIATSLDGYVVDRYRVIDHDFEGEVSRDRIEDVIAAARGVLKGESKVPPLFRKMSRFGGPDDAPTSNLPTRIGIDNNTSPRCTILDVFTHDKPGLLYTITRSLHQLEVSVMLAKISTHLDQAADVFYITDAEGNKIENGEHLRTIRDALLKHLDEFAREGHQQFVS